MHTRRTFLKIISVTAAATATGGIRPLLASANKKSTNVSRKIHLFSKHLQWLDYTSMAQVSAELGFDGIDLTVRPEGHILPENVERDLPKAVRAIRNNGLIADRISTSLTNPDNDETHRLLETAANEGIRYYRLGWLEYNLNISIDENIKIFRDTLSRFADLNKKYGMCGVYQNHSSSKFLGSPVWDLGLLLEGMDVAHIAVQYDIRHAVAEGGQSWPIGLEYLKNKINSLIIKDFIWSNESGSWKPKSVPLGEGMVDFKSYFKLINQYNSSADISIHYEYEGLGGAEHGASQLTVSENKIKGILKRDLDLLKTWL